MRNKLLFGLFFMLVGGTAFAQEAQLGEAPFAQSTQNLALNQPAISVSNNGASHWVNDGNQQTGWVGTNDIGENAPDAIQTDLSGQYPVVSQWIIKLRIGSDQPDDIYIKMMVRGSQDGVNFNTVLRPMGIYSFHLCKTGGTAGACSIPVSIPQGQKPVVKYLRIDEVLVFKNGVLQPHAELSEIEVH